MPFRTENKQTNSDLQRFHSTEKKGNNDVLLVGSKVFLAEMVRSHRVDLRRQDFHLQFNAYYQRRFHPQRRRRLAKTNRISIPSLSIVT